MKALVIVDMLNDFVEPTGALFVNRAPTLVDNIAKLKEQAKKYRLPVIYTNDAHTENDPHFQKWPVHCIRGTYGAQLCEGLKNAEDDTIIEKPELSMFTNPKAPEILKAKGIDELFVTGVATEYCVGQTVLDAAALGYKVNVVVDAIAGVDEIKLPDGTVVPETKGKVAYVLMEMAKRENVRPIYTNKALEELTR